jgi:hypothetical protein
MKITNCTLLKLCRKSKAKKDGGGHLTLLQHTKENILKIQILISGISNLAIMYCSMFITQKRLHTCTMEDYFFIPNAHHYSSEMLRGIDLHTKNSPWII